MRDIGETGNGRTGYNEKPDTSNPLLATRNDPYGQFLPKKPFGLNKTFFGLRPVDDELQNDLILWTEHRDGFWLCA
jgi:hypothetical protein